MKYKVILLLAACVVCTSWAQGLSKLTVGELIKKTIEFGTPQEAYLDGQAAQYLRQSLKTSDPILARASIIKRLDPKCVRARIRITIPTLIVEATDPGDPTKKARGPFETTTEGNFCDGK
jgi:hypothetical protein